MVLKEHFDSTITHDLNNVNRVTVRRKHIWRDAIRALSQPTFDPCRRVQVTFVGEEAVDGGGPSREFFALALQELAEDGSIFQGSQHNRFFLHNVQALASRKYFYAGILVAVSLANGGPGLPCLAEAVYTYLCYGLHYKYAPDLGLIPDINIQEKLEQVRFSTYGLMQLIVTSYNGHTIYNLS